MANGHQVVAVAADTRSGTVAAVGPGRPCGPGSPTRPRLAAYDGGAGPTRTTGSRAAGGEDDARIRLWASEHGKVLLIADGPQWPPRHDGDKWAWEAHAAQARKEWEDARERSIRA